MIIGKSGRDISQAHADIHVAGYGKFSADLFYNILTVSCNSHLLLLRMVDLALAVDVTARNLQDQARRAGLPWSAAKGFDTFTPVG